MSERGGRNKTLAGRLARAISSIVATAAFLTGAFSLVAAASQRAASGSVSSSRINFVDGTGTILRAPALALDNAYPGMPAQRSMLHLRNTGNLDEAFSVKAELSDTGSRSLNDVLVVRVRDEATGRLFYRGAISGLSFESHTTLRPGEVADYMAEISWPPTARDDLYQGIGLSFTLKAFNTGKQT